MVAGAAATAHAPPLHAAPASRMSSRRVHGHRSVQAEPPCDKNLWRRRSCARAPAGEAHRARSATAIELQPKAAPAWFVVADIDPREYRPCEESAVMLQDESMELIKQSKTLREAFEKGEQNGVKKGVKKGRRQAIEMMLRRLFLHRLGRQLTEQEQQALADRARMQDPEELEDRALSLEGEALAAWLLDSNEAHVAQSVEQAADALERALQTIHHYKRSRRIQEAVARMGRDARRVLETFPDVMASIYEDE